MFKLFDSLGEPIVGDSQMPFFEGDPQLYRAKDEVKHLRENLDCLKKFRARVTTEGWLADAELDAIDGEVLALIDQAVKTARAAPPPDESELTTDVYATY